MSDSFYMPPREKPQHETPILRACIVALNRIPDVRAVRNNNGRSPVACTHCRCKLCMRCHPRLTYPIPFGLGDGSPDIICRVALRVPVGIISAVFWIEVKAPGGRTTKERAELQRLFQDEARSRGELSATVYSDTEATARALEMIAEYKRRLGAT